MCHIYKDTKVELCLTMFYVFIILALSSNEVESNLNTAVQKIRTKFMKEYAKNPDFYNRDEYEKMKNDDSFIIEYLRYLNGSDLDNSFKFLLESLKWYNKYDFNRSKETDFPRALYRLGEFHLYDEDKDGDPILYWRMKLSYIQPEFDELEKKFISYLMANLSEKVQIQKRQVGVIVDATGAGLSNIYLKRIRWLCMIPIPKYTKYTILVDIPWLISTTYKYIVQPWLPHNTQVMSKKELMEFVGKERLPDYLGGTSKNNYTPLKKNCPRLRDYAKSHGISNGAVNAFLMEHRQAFHEAGVRDPQIVD